MLFMAQALKSGVPWSALTADFFVIQSKRLGWLGQSEGEGGGRGQRWEGTVLTEKGQDQKVS